ncbi:MAG: hypothetical protein JOZ47_08580 [Kutzneria sp.]|nr:hypothetical protein [Kutzneria sp.]
MQDEHQHDGDDHHERTGASQYPGQRTFPSAGCITWLRLAGAGGRLRELAIAAWLLCWVAARLLAAPRLLPSGLLRTIGLLRTGLVAAGLVSGAGRGRLLRVTTRLHRLLRVTARRGRLGRVPTRLLAAPRLLATGLLRTIGLLWWISHWTSLSRIGCWWAWA